MTKLKRLIQELCPNGVEYKKIEDIAIDIYRGSGIKRDQVTLDGIPCVRYGEIYTTYNLYFSECLSHTKLEYVQSPKYFEFGDILFAITGENVEEISKSIAYVGHEKCLAGGDIVVLNLNYRTVRKYALKSSFQPSTNGWKKTSLFRASSVTRVSGSITDCAMSSATQAAIRASRSICGRKKLK